MKKETKIVIADFLSKSELALWKENITVPEEIIILSPDKENEDELISILPDARILITRKRKITKNILEAGNNLILVQKMGSIPFNIDIEACKSAGIAVATWPMLSRIVVAEHAIALMLACAKQLVKGHLATIRADYRGLGLKPIRTSEDIIAFNWMNLSLEDLYSKSIGLIGFGEIALEVTRRVKAFGMEVIYYKRNRLEKKWEQFLNIKYKPLNQLLQMVDFVSLHTPYTKETKNLIGMPELNLMKKSAFLINTSRGGVIDEDALVKSLRKSQIAGAGLDVFIQEPLPIESPLRKLDNVILTPHVGGGTAGGRTADVQRLLKSISMVLAKGLPPENLVPGYEGPWGS